MTPRVRSTLAVAAAIVVIAAGIIVVRERSARTVRIDGRTVGPGGLPLSGVLVSLEVSASGSEEEPAVERLETQSDAQGNFSINFRGHWRRASYRLEAQEPGFEKLSVEGADTLRSPVILQFSQAR
jgi:hypothetical protein